MKIEFKEQLSSYIEALYPIIYFNHFDFRFVDSLIKSVSNGEKIIEYVHGIGVVDFITKSPMKEYNLQRFLDSVKDDGYDNSIFIVLKDIHSQIETPEIISLLRYIAERNLYNDGYSATVFIVSSKLVIPEELEELITVFDIPLPTEEEIRNIILDFKDSFELDSLDDGIIEDMAVSLKGLNEFQIGQILNLTYQNGGRLDSGAKRLILRQKEQFIKKSGLLELITTDEAIEDIGGLEKLKQWLKKKERIVSQMDKAVRFGVDIPKGILIAGMPGCGKSLTAKATATLFKMPLLRLDVGRLLGKYVGESEENMRKALMLAEAVSPCVLWIDEIEKAFSGIGGSGGGSDVTTRLFGQFLTWMQEKKNTVFIVATANNITQIPPEFLRKGRFDELFYVDFPNVEERKQIIEIHLKKRKKWNQSLNISLLAEETDGYNGADLEAIVKEAIEECFLNGKEKLVTEDLQNAQKNIKSISDTLGRRINEFKNALKAIDLKPAN